MSDEYEVGTLTEKAVEVDKKKKARSILFDSVDVNKKEMSEESIKQLNRFATAVETEKLDKIYDKYDLLAIMRHNGEVAQEANEIEDEFQKVIVSQEINPQKVESKVFDKPKMKRNANVNAKINFRGKLMIFGFASIVALLGFVAIFNVFSANNIKNDITKLNNNIEASEQALDGENSTDLRGLYNQYANLKKESRFANWASTNGKTEITNATGSPQSFTLRQKQEVTKDSNWFDAICDAISKLFGG